MYNDVYDYGYNASSTQEVAGAVLLSLLAVIFIILFIVSVLVIIGRWKMYEKAGEKGWKALIPIYNDVVLCQIVGVNPWWILILFSVSMFSIIPIIGPILSFASYIYFAVLINVSISRSYGKEDSFAIGLIFLKPIFYLILGAGKSKYIGKRPMNDFIFKTSSSSNENINQNSVNTNQNNQTVNNNVENTNQNNENTKYCSTCGQKVSTDAKFCTNCGNKLM